MPLPVYLSSRDTLHFDLVRSKIPKEMCDEIVFDSEQFKKSFHKTSESTTPKFIKCNDVWVYAPFRSSFLSDVRINEMAEWGIKPQTGQAIHVGPCNKREHANHDHLALFQFTNPELLAFYDGIINGSDEDRKLAVQERYSTLKTIAQDSTYGHENSCFHCTGHPMNHTNYKEIDWTIRLFYSIKNHLDADVRVKPSYSYASGNNFPTLQQQLSCCSASNVYYFKGAPDLLFLKKKATDASLLISDGDDDEVQLFDLKQGYLPVPKAASIDLPNVAGQVFAGLHFLTITKIMKSICGGKGVPKNVKSKGLLLKRKDAMWLYTLEADVNKVTLASTKATIQDMYILDNFSSAHLCAGIQELLK